MFAVSKSIPYGYANQGNNGIEGFLCCYVELLERSARNVRRARKTWFTKMITNSWKDIMFVDEVEENCDFNIWRGQKNRGNRLQHQWFVWDLNQYSNGTGLRR